MSKVAEFERYEASRLIDAVRLIRSKFSDDTTFDEIEREARSVIDADIERTRAQQERRLDEALETPWGTLSRRKRYDVTVARFERTYDRASGRYGSADTGKRTTFRNLQIDHGYGIRADGERNGYGEWKTPGGVRKRLELRTIVDVLELGHEAERDATKQQRSVDAETRANARRSKRDAL